jgi:hypothetical protein
MAIFPIQEYIQVGGKVDVFLAFPISSHVVPDFPFDPAPLNALGVPGSASAAYTQLYKLGESEDEIRPSIARKTGSVFGDRYGGREGDPIEKQFFGLGGSVRLRMSRWDPDVLGLVKNCGGLAPGGKVSLADMGALVLRDRSFRMILRSVSNVKFRYNYPCCWCDDAIEIGLGTKHSLLEFAVTAHRAPEGHWAAPSSGTDLVTGYTENRDMTGWA